MAKKDLTLDYAKLARKGEVEILAALADKTLANDRLAYKWLCVAGDFGNEDAEGMADEILETSSFANDEPGFHIAAVHWELAVAYLAAEEGLPAKLDFAASHLQQAFERHDLAAINKGASEKYSSDEVLARLKGKAKDLLAFELAGGDPSRPVLERIKLVEQLVSIKAPAIMIAGQKKLLRKEADRFFAKKTTDAEVIRNRVIALLES